MALIQFPITHGPGKFDLANALFAYNPRRPAAFQANCPVGTILEINVSSVQAEDSSGESWDIEGTVRSVDREKQMTGFYTPEVGQRVFIYFRTDRRQGHIKFFEKRPYSSPELDQVDLYGLKNATT